MPRKDFPAFRNRHVQPEAIAHVQLFGRRLAIVSAARNPVEGIKEVAAIYTLHAGIVRHSAHLLPNIGANTLQHLLPRRVSPPAPERKQQKNSGKSHGISGIYFLLFTVTLQPRALAPQ